MKKKRVLYRPLLIFLAIASLLCRLAYGSQAGAAYNAADEELNATYQKALAAITDPKDKHLFVEAQRSWIKFRDAEVAFHARYFPESKGGLFLATEMMKARTEKLKELLTESSKQEHENEISREKVLGIDMAKWEETPCISGRLATEKDVQEGRANFYFPKHIKPINIPLPACAIVHYGKDAIPVILIQAEEMTDEKRVGYITVSSRIPGSCLLSQVEILKGPDKRFK